VLRRGSGGRGEGEQQGETEAANIMKHDTAEWMK
jgi:hypothetical protein